MRRLAATIYVFSFLDDFILIYPLYAVLFAESGLTVGQISALFFVWGATAMVVSVPAGVLADRVSRRGIIVVGQAIRAAGYVVWIVEPTFIGFLVGFVLWGIKEALADGAYEALVYDELSALGRADAYVLVTGRAQSLAMLAVVAASLGAAAAISLGYDFVLWMSVAAVLAAGVAVLLLPESSRKRRVHDEHYLETLRDGLRLALRQPSVLRIILLGGFIYAIWGGLDEYWSLYMDDLGFDRVEISLAMAGIYLAAAAGTLLAHRWQRLSTAALVDIMAVLGVVLLAGVLVDAPPSALLIAAFMFGFCLIDMVLGGRLQHMIEERTRATVTSVGGVASDLMGLGVFAALGALSEPWGLQGALIAVAVLIVVVALGARPMMGRWPPPSRRSPPPRPPRPKRGRASSS